MMRYLRHMDDAVAASMKLKEQLAAHAAELKIQKAKSKLILQAREEESNALTDPDAIRERDADAAAHVNLMRSIVGGVRVPGDSSDDDDDSESESESGDESVDLLRLPVHDNETETAPQYAGEGATQLSKSAKYVKRSTVSKSRDSSTALQKKDGSNNNNRNGSGSAKSNKTNKISNDKSDSSVVVSKVITKKHKRYSYSSKDRNQGDEYSSTDSELGMCSDNSVSKKTTPPRKAFSTGPSQQKKKSRGSSFLEPILTPPSTQAHVATQSMLEQFQVSICEDLNNKKSRSSSTHHMLDNSIVAEYDPSFPDLDGHPHNDSLLHEIDERLVHLNDSDEDAEMEDNDHVGWDRNQSNSPTSAVHRNKKSNPKKAEKQQAAQEAAAAKKEEKRLGAKAKRDEAIFQRRVLEANNRRSQASETDEDQNQSSKKRRASSGISASWTGFYGVNLALNQAQLTNSDLIIGCADNVLGRASESSSASPRDNATDVDYSVVLSYRKQSGAVCDKVLKQKLMKHSQLDIFKEITFERLITEYSVAKRESVGVADDEIIDIDWFEVMDGFSVNLKHRLSANSRIILGRIHTAIDNDNKVTAKFAMKERFTKSMNAFLRHGYRTINSIITKTVHKIGTHFDSLNFSDALPRYETFGRKTQGFAFSFTASLYNVFDENTAALTTGGDTFGVDPLLCEIMKTATNEHHIADIIEYSLIKKSKYTDSPASYTALRKYLDKRKGSQVNTGETELNGQNTSTTTSSTSLLTDVNNTSASNEARDNSNSARDDLWSTNNTHTPIHHKSPHNTNFTSDITSSGSKATGEDSLLLSVADLSFPSSTANNQSSTSDNINKQLFSSDRDSSPEYVSADKRQLEQPLNTQDFVNKFFPIATNDADKSIDKTTSATLCSQAVTCMRQFLLLLLSDVKHNDNIMYLKLNTKHNVRATRNLSFMKFLEENMQLDDVAMYELFCGSAYFKSLSCMLMIPFHLNDQFNILGDGYCFYRAIFALLLRAQSEFTLTADELKCLDLMLKQSGEEGDKLRAQFQDFYSRIEGLFPDPKAKAKVAAAGCTFTNLSTYLDERFWGGSDSVPFLDYPCTAFSYNKEESSHLSGCWAKMYCSSIPGLVSGRDTIHYNDVGSAYSLHDVLMVLMRPHNWLLHKQVHFFISDHSAVELNLKAFSSHMSAILSELRLRVTAAKPEHSTLTFTEVYDRMNSGSSTTDDVLWLTTAKNLLERQLTEQNFFFGDEEEGVVAQQQSAEKQKESFLATPFGATQEQKIYISTINNTVAVKESENELLRTQLAGLKDMILRNSASAKCPIFIDCDQ